MSILISSKNPNNTSLTVRGLALQAVPFVLILTSSVAGFESWDESTLVNLIDTTSMIVALVTEAASLVMIAWGLIRKLIP